MSQENVELWRASTEENARLVASEGFDQEAALSKMAELWNPEIELDASESKVPGLNGVYRGIEACKQFWREWYGAWDTIHFEYELLDAGDRVVMLMDADAPIASPRSRRAGGVGAVLTGVLSQLLYPGYEGRATGLNRGPLNARRSRAGT